ncbi:hypothetical protein JCM10212_003064 [Sporobolomyces blumeae]
MATPSTAFPFSPTPTSPTFHAGSNEPSTPTTADDRRRSSKRASTRYDDPASRYPSPPAQSPPLPSSSSTTSVPTHRSRPSYDPSLVIPPFNPNKRRSTGSSSAAAAAGGAGAAPTRRNSQTQHAFDKSILPSPPLPAQYQTTHAHAHAHRPVSAAAIPAVPAIPAIHQSHVQGQPSHQFAPPNQQQQQRYFPGAPGPAATSGPGGSVSSRARQSVGYLPTNSSLAGQGPYPHLYNPHPMPRQKIYFGPYILLQTLGEGEFGKVKLGVHGERWGEDVAIKLIKRGNVDTAQRGEKVRREIEVLKMVRHPNIVRLYDVIETEKYIGIVLEYASGGELFDHILAHRYLKERDASRLFAQLISGVAYLHQKGVVHRDLKLENLLLDRNRNVIITDFGFANRFNDASVDLMATSCGSPCYAAPELVVQDGRYVGTAVDVWSCGVILYAMLSGYLPYDDDPANPEGDNINLLYKYILNTPLTFPDWVTEEPRHLLHMMLVPDPTLRCTIEDVTRHSWLRKYASAFDKSVEQLEYQAQEMEMAKRQALEVQRQWLVQQQHAQHLAAQGLAPAMSRSQTSTSGMGIAVPPSTAQKHRSAMVTSTTASAPLVQHGFESYSMSTTPKTQTPTVVEEQTVSPRSRTSSTASRPMVVGTSERSSSVNRRSGAYVSSSPPTTQAQFVAAEADPFSFETRHSALPSPALESSPMVPSLSAPAATSSASSTSGGDQVMLDAPTAASTARSRRTSTRVPPPAPSSGAGTADSAAADWRKKAHRATVQVEYDGGSASRRRAAPRSPIPPQDVSEEQQVAAAPAAAVAEPVAVASESTAPSLEVRNESDRAELSPSPVPSMAISVSTTTESGPAEDVMHEAVQSEPEALAPPVVETITVPTPETLTPVVTEVAELPESSPVPSVETEKTPTVLPSRIPFPTPSTPPRNKADSNDTPRKRKSSSSPAHSHAQPEPTEVPPPLPEVELTPKAGKKSSAASQASVPTTSARKDSNASTVQRPRPGLPSDRFSIRSFLGAATGATDKAPSPTSSERPKTGDSGSKDTALDEVTNRRKANRRQKALSLQPFRQSTNSKIPKQAKANVDYAAATAKDSSRNRSTTRTPGSMPPPPIPTTQPAAPAWVRSGSSSRAPANQSKRLSADLEANWSASQASATPSGKAKAVMDWFRRRGTKGHERDLAPISTDFDRRASSQAREPSTPSSVASIREESPVIPPQASPAEARPAVVVTPSQPLETTQPAPSSRSTSGAQSEHSAMSSATASTAATTVSTSGASTIQPANDKRDAVAPVVPAAPVVSRPAPVATSTFAPSKLRFHQGALDKNAVTYRSPDEVILDIKTSLWNMGVDMAMEGDYKIKCVRKSRKKAMAVTGSHRPSIASGSTQSTSSSIGPAASSTLDRRSGLPASPSLPQSPSMGFRSLFNRSKYASGSPSLPTSPSFSTPGSPELDPLSSPMTTSVSQFSMLSLSGHATPAPAQPLPVYGGEKTADAGDEVRFVVELTRVKNLDRLYCVDIKRMKGGPWSYKHVYEQLLGVLELGPVV